jgi:glutamine synthetase
MSAKNVMKMIEDNEVKFIDFRFTDTIGKEQHVSVPAHTIPYFQCHYFQNL